MVSMKELERRVDLAKRGITWGGEEKVEVRRPVAKPRATLREWRQGLAGLLMLLLIVGSFLFVVGAIFGGNGVAFVLVVAFLFWVICWIGNG
jgi:hypothetical protein